jgi:hypothetical protein
MLTKFTIEDIQADLLKAMEMPNPEFKNKKLDLPAENDMVPRNFDVVPTDNWYTH